MLLQNADKTVWKALIYLCLLWRVQYVSFKIFVIIQQGKYRNDVFLNLLQLQFLTAFLLFLKLGVQTGFTCATLTICTPVVESACSYNIANLSLVQATAT